LTDIIADRFDVVGGVIFRVDLGAHSPSSRPAVGRAAAGGGRRRLGRFVVGRRRRRLVGRRSRCGRRLVLLLLLRLLWLHHTTHQLLSHYYRLQPTRKRSTIYFLRTWMCTGRLQDTDKDSGHPLTKMKRRIVVLLLLHTTAHQHDVCNYPSSERSSVQHPITWTLLLNQLITRPRSSPRPKSRFPNFRCHFIRFYGVFRKCQWRH